jgi:NADPH:quinone reductase-like Zn-dependent oxidoreductase
MGPLDQTRAVRVVRLGMPPEIAVETVDVEPAAGDVVLRLRAAEVTPLDRQIAGGGLPRVRAVPVPPGQSAVASTTHGRLLVLGGPSGMGVTRPGTLADTFAAPATAVFDLPDAIPDQIAAAAATSLVTAHLALFQRARLRPGERVLVSGATGAVGSAAVAVALDAGAVVVAAARDPARCDVPDAVTLVADSDLPDAARDGGRGVDVIIDTVGGDALTATVLAGAPRCRHVVVGYAGGTEAVLRVTSLMIAEHDILGFNAHVYSSEQWRQAVSASLDLLERGAYRPRIAAVYPLAEAARAFDETAPAGRVLVVP